VTDKARVGLARTVWRYALRQKAAFVRWRESRYRAWSNSLILSTPPAPVDPQSETEIHSLTCEKDYADLLWCLKSLRFHSGRGFNVVVHDDGSLSPRANGHLREHLPGLTIVSKPEADERMRDLIRPYDACRQFRDRLPLARRLFDFPVFATRNQFMILDSDILFFANPAEMFDLMDRHRPFFMADYQDGYVYPRAEIAKRYGVDVMPAFNTGISYFAKEMFDNGFIETFCRDLEAAGFQSHPWAEQSLFAMLLSRHPGGADRLPAAYAISRRNINDRSVCGHFVNDGSRGLFYTYGIPRLLREGFLERGKRGVGT